jgi:hypothetical protein
MLINSPSKLCSIGLIHSRPFPEVSSPNAAAGGSSANTTLITETAIGVAVAFLAVILWLIGRRRLEDMDTGVIEVKEALIDNSRQSIGLNPQADPMTDENYAFNVAGDIWEKDVAEAPVSEAQKSNREQTEIHQNVSDCTDTC